MSVTRTRCVFSAWSMLNRPTMVMPLAARRSPLMPSGAHRFRRRTARAPRQKVRGAGRRDSSVSGFGKVRRSGRMEFIAAAVKGLNFFQDRPLYSSTWSIQRDSRRACRTAPHLRHVEGSPERLPFFNMCRTVVHGVDPEISPEAVTVKPRRRG